MSQIGGEILIESLKVKHGSSNASSAQQQLLLSKCAGTGGAKRRHQYGTVASVGFCMVDVCSYSSGSSLLPLKLEGNVEDIQLEWSKQLSIFVSSLAK